MGTSGLALLTGTAALLAIGGPTIARAERAQAWSLERLPAVTQPASVAAQSREDATRSRSASPVKLAAVETVAPGTPSVDADSLSGLSRSPGPVGAIEDRLSVVSTIRLAEAEELAVAASPVIEQLVAEVHAAEWHAVQVGLKPNPVAGYTAGEIGNEGQAGQQGAFLSQRFVRGGKLGRARAVAREEVSRRQERLAAERLRVLADTRAAFFETHLAQREAEVARELTRIGGRAAGLSTRLFQAGEGKRTDLLLAEVEAQRAAAQLRGARQRRRAAWRRLATLTALPTDPIGRVVADEAALTAPLDWDVLVGETLATSPLVAERVAAIAKARNQVAYESSLAVPDVTAQMMMQYDDATGDPIAGVQVSAPLMLWNRNQGGIGRAQAELTAATRRLEATEQTLRRGLAEAAGRYEASCAVAEALQQQVLPRAEENLRLATTGYEAGEIAFLDLLTVQRTYFQASLEAIAALREANTAGQALRTGLLTGSGMPLDAGQPERSP